MVSIRSMWQGRHRAMMHCRKWSMTLLTAQHAYNHPTLAICFRVHTLSSICILTLSRVTLGITAKEVNIHKYTNSAQMSTKSVRSEAGMDTTLKY